VPDRHKEGRKSKYTADRQMPGAFEGETVTRRRFMNVAAQGSGIVATAAIALPALGFAIGPVFSRLPWNWQPIGPPSDFSETNYQTKVITIVQNIGEAGNSIAYVRARNPELDTEPQTRWNHWVALSSRCAHLGCPVRYVAAAERFVCPCHGGVYDFTGQVVGGPPVRPLDRFYTRLNTATGLVEIGPRFSVNDQLVPYSPRDPAQPLNGIGQYLYPSRFDTAKGPAGY
jgi:menaquinol-cytochrome c reductase iron-sulfur subunit